MEFTNNPTNDAEMALSAYRSGMKRTRIPTGLAELDEVLGGGFVPSFVLLHGKPSVGKTTFARQLAYQMSEKDKVTYGSYTHDVNDLVCKALSMYSYIQNPLMAMTADEFASKKGWDNIPQEKADFIKAVYDRFEYDSASKNMTTLDMSHCNDIHPCSLSHRGEPRFHDGICFSDGEVYNYAKTLSISIVTDGVMDSASWKKYASLASYIISLKSVGVYPWKFHTDEKGHQIADKFYPVIEARVEKNCYGASGGTVPFVFINEFSVFVPFDAKP